MELPPAKSTSKSPKLLTSNDMAQESKEELDAVMGSSPSVYSENEDLRQLDPFFPELYHLPAYRPQGFNHTCNICSFMLKRLACIQSLTRYNGVDHIIAAAMVGRHLKMHSADIPISPVLLTFRMPNHSEIKTTRCRDLSVHDVLRLRRILKDVVKPSTCARASTQPEPTYPAIPAIPPPPPPATHDSDQLPPNPFAADDLIPSRMLVSIAKARISRHSKLITVHVIEQQKLHFAQWKRTNDDYYERYAYLNAQKLRDRVGRWLDDLEPVYEDTADECQVDPLEGQVQVEDRAVGKDGGIIRESHLLDYVL